MTPAARYQAAIEVFDTILAGQPSEKALTNWARSHRFAGSKDRAAVRDIVFDGLRRRDSAMAAGGATTGRGLVMGLLRLDGLDLASVFSGEGHAPLPLSSDELTTPLLTEELLDIPGWLEEAFTRSLGAAAPAAIAALRHRAPITLRVNSARISRAAAQALLAEAGIATEINPLSETALTVIEGARAVSAHSAYLDGLIELQDASSQAVIDALPLPDAGRVLDFCAGGGGKSLAMAARSKARFFAHDINSARLQPLTERARRARARVQLCVPGKAAAHGPYDLVLCDVPCSGSGAWRRAPEAKWNFSQEDLARLNVVQAKILREAADLVCKTGVLAYATCSVIDAENTKIVEAFLDEFPGKWRLAFQKQWLPDSSGDGFFVSIFNLK